MSFAIAKKMHHRKVAVVKADWLRLIATCMQFYKSAIHKLEGGYLQTDLSANEYGHSELETGCPPSDDHAVESGFCRYLQLFSWSLQLLAICLLVN